MANKQNKRKKCSSLALRKSYESRVKRRRLLIENQTNSNDIGIDNTMTAKSELHNDCQVALEQPDDLNTPRIEHVGDIDSFSLNIEIEKREEFHPISGRRIIDIDYLMTQLQEKAQHNDLFDCKLGFFKLIGEKRTGLKSKFKFECNLCRNVVIIDSEKCDSADNVDVNVAATTGVIAAGIGFTQFQEICSAIDVPVFSEKYYITLQDAVYDHWERTAAEEMKISAEREKEAAIAEGLIKNGMALVDVYVDGAWGSRSYGNNYRAMSGTAAIIGKRFGEVLYIGVKNKYCLVCARALKLKTRPKDHTCFKNYDGPSSAMEAEIICEGFRSSVEMYGIIYARMIGDGDSSTYKKVLEAKPYDHLNHVVEKIECRNHVLRNFCNKLRALSKETKYPMKYRKTLTNEKVMSMRKIIVASIKIHKNSANAKSTSINLLHKNITNSVAHAYGDHRLCEDYNCSKEKNLGNNTMKEIENSTFLFRVNAIVATTASKARSLIEDVDTNVVERFNSVIAKFVGGKRVNFSQRRGYQGRCSAAVVAFNRESAISSVQKSILGKSPRGKVKEIELRRSQKKRINRMHPAKKNRKIERSSTQHNYGPTSSAPDLSSIQLDMAKEDFLRNLKVMTKDKTYIERSTVLQKDSSQWMELRKNLITASNFGTVCKRKLSKSSANTVKNLIYKKNIGNITSVAHGVEHEKQALQQLERQENINIEPCGLFIDETYPFIGATPDGLVGNDTIVEVKCPITAFKTGIISAIEANKIQLYKFDKKNKTRVINKKSNWYYQVQGQLHVTKKSLCIFGIWSGENNPLIVERISKDDEFWKQEMENKIVEFYMKCLLPEIVDPRRIRGLPIRDIILEEGKENDISCGVKPDPSKLNITTNHPTPLTHDLCNDHHHCPSPQYILQPRQLQFDEF